MTAKTTKPQPTVKLTLRSGPLTPHMKRCWKLWWAARIADAKREVASER